MALWKKTDTDIRIKPYRQPPPPTKQNGRCLRWRSLKTPAEKVRASVEIIRNNNALYTVILEAVSITNNSTVIIIHK